MAQKDIEQWAKMLQEAEAEDQAYEKACNDSIKEAEDAINDVELGEEDEVIDPASLGFVDSEEDVAEDDMLDGRPHNGHLDEEDELTTFESLCENDAFKSNLLQIAGGLASANAISNASKNGGVKPNDLFGPAAMLAATSYAANKNTEQQIMRKAFLRDSGAGNLTDPQICLLALIFEAGENGVVWPELKKLLEKIPRLNLSREMKRLIDADFVEEDWHMFSRNVYHITLRGKKVLQQSGYDSQKMRSISSNLMKKISLDENFTEDHVDLAECGFTEDGKVIAEKEAEEDLQEALHKDDEYASMELEVEETGGFDGDNTSFEDALHAEVPDVMIKKVGLGSGGVSKYRISGFLGDLKEAYAFYLGLYGWDDVVKQGEEPAFNELVVFQDGDTLQEADYREAIAHVFDPIGVKASTANLKANNVCQLSVVKEAVKAEKEKRQKALLEADLEDMTDEQLDNLDQALAAGEAVDNDEADAYQERAWLSILKSMGINSIEEYRAMDPKEFEKRWEASNAPLDAANGFARSKLVFRAYHKPDDEAGGATHTDFAFNPDYYHRVTRAEAAREAVKAEKKARENASTEFPKRGQDTWSLADFGKMLQSLGPKKAKELQKTMLEIAHEDNKDNPEAEAREVMFIKKLFGQKMPTFRDIARAWYPGQDPNTRQQSVNKFCQDTLGNFYQATREATGSQNGGLANFKANVLGNERNFRKFLQVMKDMSDKRASNSRSIINKGKKLDTTTSDDQATETPTSQS